MRIRRSFSLTVLLACLLGGSDSKVFADATAVQAKPKLSAGEAWKQIVSARAALDRAMATDLKTLSPESLAVARKRAAEQASKFDDMTSEFADEFPADTNMLRVIAHNAYAVGIEGVLGERGRLNEAANHVAGVEFESELAKQSPALSSHAKVLRVLSESNLVAGAIAALRFQPTNHALYLTLIEFGEKANSEAGKVMLHHLLTNSLLPAVMAGYAKSILNRQFSVGQPLDLKFTAMDGRKVDLRQMRGKVVLVNFWATTCAPCMAEFPELKSIYQQYRERGFEIVGISLDDETDAVERAIRAKEIPWPNTINVGGWTNGLAGKCGIFAIPNGWLVDRKGVLREVAARWSVEEKVKALLAERQ